MMIVMRRDLKMRKGKIAAQAGHAAVEAVLLAIAKEDRTGDLAVTSDGVTLLPNGKADSALSLWFRDGCAKICVYVDSEEELLSLAARAEEKGILCAVITDAGCTEFHGQPTRTCLAVEPLDEEIADSLTGELPLY